MNFKQGITAVMAVSLVFALSGIAPAIELLTYYKFNNDTLNFVPGSPDGTARGDTGLPQYVSGAAGNALEFEESDYQAVDTTTSGYPLPSAKVGTVSFWAKTTQPGNATTGYGYFFGTAHRSGKTLLQSLAFNKDHATTPGRIGLNMRSNENHWYYLYTKSIGEGGITDWLDGEWHQIVFAWDTTDDATYQGAIYIDGVAQPQDLTINSDAIPATDTFIVPVDYPPMYLAARGNASAGEVHDYAQYPYDGALDDVQIYDSMISAADATWLYNHPGEPLEGSIVIYMPGDANRDKTVDADDAAILAQNWLATGADWSMGDFNEDTVVDDKDATLMATNWGLTLASGAASVPEPGTIVLLLGALIMAVFTCKSVTRV